MLTMDRPASRPSFNWGFRVLGVQGLGLRVRGLGSRVLRLGV